MDVRDLRRTLRSKLHAIEDRATHHVFFYFDIDGRQYRATKLSHGLRGQLAPSLESLVARQLRLRREELAALVECPLSEEEYFSIWLQRSQR